MLLVAHYLPLLRLAGAVLPLQVKTGISLSSLGNNRAEGGQEALLFLRKRSKVWLPDGRGGSGAGCDSFKESEHVNQK